MSLLFVQNTTRCVLGFKCIFIYRKSGKEYYFYDSAESGEASDSNEDDYSNVADAKVRAQDRQNKIYSMRYDKKSSALSELKAKRQERERKDQERKEKKELENRDTEGKESSSGEGTEYTTGKRKSFKKERSRSRSSSSSRYY